MRAALLLCLLAFPASDHAHHYQSAEEWEWERCTAPSAGWRHRVCHQDRCSCGHTRGYRCGAWSACDLRP